ncbi:MAG: PAS domain-containing protein, partial [Candidatus Krumholzibacteriaceae bacterium]
MGNDARRDERHRDITAILSDFYYAVEVAPDGSSRLEWIEGPFEYITGVRRKSIRGIEDWIARLHPDDAPAFSRAFQAALSGAPATVDYRLGADADDGRWLRDRLHPTRDGEGTRVTRVIGAVRDISEYKRAEDALRTIEKRLELAMEGAEIGYWDHYFKTGVIVRSANWTRMLGYSADEIPPDMASWKNLVHPDDLGAVERILADHIAGRIPFFKAAHRLRTKSGDWKWVLNWGKIFERDEKGRPLRAAGIHLDLTEVKQAETALRESEERYRAVVQQSRDAIFLADMGTRRILDCNQALAGLLGYDLEELRAMTLYDFIDHPREDIDQKIEMIAARGGADIGERRYRHHNGSRIAVEVNGTVISYNGKEVMCVISRDMTARKRAEAEQRQLQIHLQETQRLESLGVLAGGIAHDFNNLLVGVLGNASLALEEMTPNSPTRELIEQIERSGRRAAELSKQLLAYSGKGSLLKQDVNLSEIVSDNLNLLGTSTSRKARITLDLAKSAPVADADATQLRQVILNLLTNASEALEDHVGDITVSTGVLTLSRSY